LSGRAREVRAPAGIDAIVPEEMTVRCGAGTTVAELDDALAERGQTVALPSWAGATVGGVLALGRSGIRRLGYGPVRDTVLQLGVVSATGALVKAGGPTDSTIAAIKSFSAQHADVVAINQLEMWQADTFDPNRIDLRVVNASERETALQSGQVDLAINLPVREAGGLQSEPRLAAELDPITRIILLQVRNDLGFADQNVRLAAHHAIDKKANTALFKANDSSFTVPIPLHPFLGCVGVAPAGMVRPPTLGRQAHSRDLGI